jgi:hypothetical protein
MVRILCVFPKQSNRHGKERKATGGKEQRSEETWWRLKRCGAEVKENLAAVDVFGHTGIGGPTLTESHYALKKNGKAPNWPTHRPRQRGRIAGDCVGAAAKVLMGD